ncbi:MAG: hypothetical protein KAR12_17300 [Methylococcales bacterium]|nr:hypothetical protein [Methylococcales bacterium]
MAHRATNVRVFGSVIRNEYTDLSDLGLLIDPTPETEESHYPDFLFKTLIYR